MKKFVFVSDGTKNSGLGIVRKFASEGYYVFIGSRTLEESEQAAELVRREYGVLAKGYKTTGTLTDIRPAKSEFYF